MAIPFWGVELIGLLITEDFSIKNYLPDFFFINPATGYGWFMGYIIVCYIFFYVVKVVSQKLSLTDKQEILLMMAMFVLLFIYESTMSVNLNMPFLRARQMLLFPFGVFVRKYREEIERVISGKKILLISGGITGIAFMGITQDGAIKAMPYIVSNLLSLLTCFPLAVVVIVAASWFTVLLRNRFLKWIGSISYEVYLVHAFTLRLIETNAISIIYFLIITIAFAKLINIIERRMNCRKQII